MMLWVGMAAAFLIGLAGGFCTRRYLERQRRRQFQEDRAIRSRVDHSEGLPVRVEPWNHDRDDIDPGF